MDQNRANQDQLPQHPQSGSDGGTAFQAVDRTPEASPPEEQRVATMDAIHDAGKHADALRAYALPEGSEPAFTFRPIPTSDGSDGEQDHG